jgi:hypothetical protein
MLTRKTLRFERRTGRMDTKIEIEIRLKTGVQQLGMAWLTDYIKRSLQCTIGEEESVVVDVGEIKIVRTVFTTKIK